MKILCLSDLHRKYNTIDFTDIDVDMIIIAGDWTITESLQDVENINFLEWLEDLDIKHKLVIAGNHELLIESDPELWQRQLKIAPSVTYLHNSGIEIEGIKFWGTPDTPCFYDWAFNRTEQELEEILDAVPEDTNVIISHGPPKGILDAVLEGSHVGSDSLRKKCLELPNLKACIFGHIHESKGEQIVHGVRYMNVSYVDRGYRALEELHYLELNNNKVLFGEIPKEVLALIKHCGSTEDVIRSLITEYEIKDGFIDSCTCIKDGEEYLTWQMMNYKPLSSGKLIDDNF